MKTRILYREVGAGTTPSMDSKSQLRAAYVAVIGDVRILAEQRKKVQRKRIVTAAYSVDNDLDVYKLSAQLSVINKDRITSIGDLESRISKLRVDYEKQRQEINNHIEEHNRLVSLWEQAQLYKTLSAKDKLSASEELKLTVCRQAMDSNDIHTFADIDRLKERTENLNKKISALKENREGCKKRYDVYMDIHRTYTEISKGNFISNLMEEERMQRERERKNRKGKKL